MAKKVFGGAPRQKKRAVRAVFASSFVGKNKSAAYKRLINLIRESGDATITEQAFEEVAKKLSRHPRNFLAKSRAKEIGTLPFQPESFTREDLDKAMEALKSRRITNAA